MKLQSNTLTTEPPHTPRNYISNLEITAYQIKAQKRRAGLALCDGSFKITVNRVSFVVTAIASFASGINEGQ